MQHRPDLIAVLGHASLLVMHLRQGAVAPFDRRRSPWKGLGVLCRPCLPILSHSGRQLLGEGVRLQCGLHGLQHLCQLGLPSRATRACAAPATTGGQQVFHLSSTSVSGPRVAHRARPPATSPGGHASELRADLLVRTYSWAASSFSACY